MTDTKSETPLTDCVMRNRRCIPRDNQMAILDYDDLAAHSGQLERDLATALSQLAEARRALEWIVDDARYKAPEQYADPRTTARWVNRAAVALALASLAPPSQEKRDE